MNIPIYNQQPIADERTEQPSGLKRLLPVVVLGNEYIAECIGRSKDEIFFIEEGPVFYEAIVGHGIDPHTERFSVVLLEDAVDVAPGEARIFLLHKQSAHPRSIARV